MGAELAREAGVAADVIVPVPDSGVPAAIGYAQECGIPYELGIIRNHYVGRTFIEPTQQIRQLGVRLKHSANRAVVNGKRIVLVDDSIVRGTTSTKIVQMMRDAGATRSAFPHRLAADHASGLLRHRHAGARQAARRDPRRSRRCARFIGADSLAFLSVDGHLPRDGPRAARSRAAAVHRPLLHRRLSDPAHRPHRARPRAAAIVAAGRGELTPACKPLAGRIALITGASRGIGHATAIALAKAGAHVVAIARTVGGLEELDDAIKAAGGTATLVPLDLKDYDGIDRLGASLHERYGKLDVLVANAGILGALSPMSHVEPKVFDDVMAVNVTANYRLIRSLDPLLQKSDAGRAVFLTSGAAWTPMAYWGPYSVSKAAVELMARIYAAETATTNLRVNVFNPGPIRTRMRASAMPGEDPMTLDTPENCAEKIIDLCLPSYAETGTLYNYRVKKFLTFSPPSG